MLLARACGCSSSSSSSFPSSAPPFFFVVSCARAAFFKGETNAGADRRDVRFPRGTLRRRGFLGSGSLIWRRCVSNPSHAGQGGGIRNTAEHIAAAAAALSTRGSALLGSGACMFWTLLPLSGESHSSAILFLPSILALHPFPLFISHLAPLCFYG